MEKFVVLNSGGFDSTVMIHRIREIYPDACIFNVFFNYGQPALNAERACSKKASEKLDCIFVERKIPKFNWTTSEFYNITYDTDKQYIEYRNLIFLSYATSMAEAYGCDKIFMALFYLPEAYKDCSMQFIERYNKLIAPSGIEVITPFGWLAKEDMYKMAQRFELKFDGFDFFSCNSPSSSRDGSGNNGLVPCGLCEDCEALREIYGEDLSPFLS